MNTTVSDTDSTIREREADAPDSSAPPPTVLATVVEILERGWLQNGWCLYDPAPLRHRLRFGPARPDQIRSACLLAAITVAADRSAFLINIERDAMPWIDRVWKVLNPNQSPHHIAPRERMRDLVTWNDKPERTRHEVIAAVRAAEYSDTQPARAA